MTTRSSSSASPSSSTGCASSRSALSSRRPPRRRPEHTASSVTLTAMAEAPTRNLGRISEIFQVAARHGFGYFLETHRLVPWRGRREDVDGGASQRGQHLREMLDELGPTFVKFGQLLSMRPDVLPPDIIAELRSLQDDVRPFPFADVERVIEEDLELSIGQLF